MSDRGAAGRIIGVALACGACVLACAIVIASSPKGLDGAAATAVALFALLGYGLLRLLLGFSVLLLLTAPLFDLIELLPGRRKPQAFAKPVDE